MAGRHRARRTMRARAVECTKAHSIQDLRGHTDDSGQFFCCKSNRKLLGGFKHRKQHDRWLIIGSFVTDLFDQMVYNRNPSWPSWKHFQCHFLFLSKVKLSIEEDRSSICENRLFL